MSIELKEATPEDERMEDCAQEEKGKLGVCFMLKKDKVYRNKFVQTVWIAWSLFLLGWIFGQGGPSFLDILAITNTDIEKGSAYVTSAFVSYVVGALIGGYLFDKLDKQLLLFSSIFICAVDMAVIPWCKAYVAMIVAQALSGFLQGAWDAMANAQVIFIWGAENGPYMQAIQFAFAVGGMISPLVTAPFLLPISKGNNSSLSLMPDEFKNHSFINNSLSISSNYDIFHFEHSGQFMFSNITNATSNVTSDHGIVSHRESRLYIAFSITAGLCLSSAIPFLVFYFQSKSEENKEDESVKNAKSRNISISLKILTLIHVMTYMSFFGVVESMVVQYLPPFCTLFLNWNKSDGSTIMTLYWLTFGIGRFSGIFLIKYFRYINIMIFFGIFLVLDAVGLLLSSMYFFHIGVWIFGPLQGFGVSIVFPVIITWTEVEMFPVTGLISALYLIGGSALRMLNPMLLGYLMEEVSSLYFCYLLFGYAILCSVLSFLLICLSKMKKKELKGKPSHKDKEIYIAVPTENTH